LAALFSGRAVTDDDAMIAMLLLGAALSQTPSGARLVLEDLDGKRSEIPAAGLALHDPRERGAWIVRPQGFPAPSAPTAAAGQRIELTLVNGDELRGRVQGGSGE